jgi:hypothetical protein
MSERLMFLPLVPLAWNVSPGRKIRTIAVTAINREICMVTWPVEVKEVHANPVKSKDHSSCFHLPGAVDKSALDGLQTSEKAKFRFCPEKRVRQREPPPFQKCRMM